MALAKYFSKDLLAIAQVLKPAGNDEFRKALQKGVVGIAFDEEALTQEGNSAFDLTIRLLSRLYPKIRLINLCSSANDLEQNAGSLAKAINSQIEIVNAKPTATVVIGNTGVSKSIADNSVFYIGSNGWNALLSDKEPVGVGKSMIPFGAGIAACLGASNVFRVVFKKFLDNVEYDRDVNLSLITLQEGEVTNSEIETTVDLGQFALVGFGAIGNGTVWGLSRCPFIKGKMTVVDPESVDITNLQRYVMTEESDENRSKVTLAKECMKGTSVKVNPVRNDWAGYLAEKIGNWKNQYVMIAVDNVADRIGIQSSLPEKLVNGYTENNLIGISRHYDFTNDTCLVCTYMPNEQGKSDAQEVSDNLGLSEMERQIRDYLFYNLPADQKLINWIAEANSIESSELEQFKGMPMNEFYSKVVCGGVLMELRQNDKVVQAIEAPLAFQSGMAGILLASELVIDKAGLRKRKFPIKTHFHPLYPVKLGSNPYNHSFSKDSTGRCICVDEDFVDTYRKKWGVNGH